MNIGKLDKLVLTILILALLFCLGGITGSLITKSEQVIVNTETYNDSNVLSAIDSLSNQLTLKKTNCDQDIYVESCAGSFESITQNVANINDYQINQFDCDQFAQEWVHQMKTAGFKQARVVSVSVDCRRDFWKYTNCADSSGRHTIARIGDLFVETTSGNIIMPKNYDDYNLTRRIYNE